nr:hypothetical protein [Tanacetum cinerariifolium]
MSSLFVDTHNVVSILEKSDAAEGFEQIIDSLSGSYIHYAFTVNPHIYISCIKQFWNTASVKRSDDVTRLQALVDKKKIVISEVVIRKILQLDDDKGIECLPNEEIFAGSAQMGYEKSTSWNEFSTAMDSAVICLSKVQKFNFSKYIFDSLVRNVDSSSKFYMVGKGFSKVETPLFEGMLAVRQPTEEGVAEAQGADLPTHIQQILDVCSALTRRVKNLENDKADQKLEIIKLKARVKKLEMANKVKSLKLRRLRKVGASRRVESSDDIEDVFNQGRMIDDMDKDEGIELVEIYNLDLDHSSKVLSMQEDDSKVKEVVEVVTTAKLITDVVTAASQVRAASATISAAKPSIPTAAPTVVAAYTKRRKGVIIRDLEKELSLKTPAETPAETPKVKDKGKGIMVETPKPIKKKDQIELDAEYARKLHEEINKDHEEFNKDIDWNAAMDHVNQKSKNPQYIKRYQGMKKRPQTESEARKNMMIYLKNTVGYKIDFFKRMTEEMEEEDQEIIKGINETPVQKAAKRRKLSKGAQEAKDLRKRLEVVDDEDDDVFIEATPLARKETIAMGFHQTDTKEVSDKFISPCFVNGLESFDGEINLGVDENMISNEYAVKLCLEHEVKIGNKVVKKELIVSLREIKEEEKSLDDWDHLLDFNLDDIPLLGEEELLPSICKIEKSNCNKKRSMENLSLFYQDIGTSSSAGGHLTQEEAAKEALAIGITQKFALLEEVRPIIKTMAYHDKYKKVLNEIWKDNVELDEKIVKEGEEAIKRIKGEVLKEKDDHKAFVFPIRLEGKREEMKKVDRGITMINHTHAKAIGMLTNVLCQVGVTTIIDKFLILDKPIDRDAQIVEYMMMRPYHQDPNALDNMKPYKRYCSHKFIMSSCYGKDATEMQSLELCHEFYSTYEFDEVYADDEMQTNKIIKFRLGGRTHSLTLLEFARRLGLYQAVELDEDDFNVYFEGCLHSDEHFNAHEYWLSVSREDSLGLSRSHTSTIKSLILSVIHKMITYGLCQRTTGYDKI